MRKFEQFSREKEGAAEAESPEARFSRLAEEAEAAGGARFEQQTKDGLGDHWVEDAQKRRLYEIKFALNDPKDPEKGTSYYYDKQFSYNEKGHLVHEEGKDLSPDKKGNAWKADFDINENGWIMGETVEVVGGPEAGAISSKQFERSDRGEVTSEIGEIHEGPDKGHKWQKQFNKKVLEDGTDVFQENGEVLEQGQNPKKEPKGHAWQQVWETKEGATTHGGKITGGREQGRTWGSWEQLKTVS